MFRSSFRLPVRLLGIQIRLDTSFLLVLPLFAWLIGSQIPSYGAFLESFIDIDASRLQHGLTPYLLGLIAAIGLFASVLVHELGHAVIARLYGVEVQEITLWFLGGLAQFEELPKQRGAEAMVAVAGPVTSLILVALGFGATFLAATGLPSATVFVFSYLALTNLFLAVFNRLPALPLDGGRILRSLLALAMPNTRATRIAGAASRAVALLLVFIGIFRLDVFVLIVAFFHLRRGQGRGTKRLDRGVAHPANRTRPDDHRGHYRRPRHAPRTSSPNSSISNPTGVILWWTGATGFWGSPWFRMQTRKNTLTTPLWPPSFAQPNSCSKRTRPRTPCLV